MKRVEALARIGIMVIMVSTLCSSPLWAVNVEEFYRGKKMSLVVGSSPGGGYDTHARLVARHLGKYIPGHPTIVVQNKPGAGSLIAANYLYNNAPKDGRAIGTLQRGFPMMQIIGLKSVKYDANKFTWLGSVNNEVAIIISWHTSAVKTIQDAMKKELIVGATQPASDNFVFSKILNDVLATKFKIISGYKGSGDILLAIERGELEGYCGWSWSNAKRLRSDWIKEKKVNIILQTALTKHRDLPNVPLVMDLVTDNESRQVLELVFSRMAMAWPFVAPPGLPRDRGKALQNAFAKTMKDPKFIGEAKKVLKVDINPVSGQEIKKIMERIFSFPKRTVERTKTAMGVK